LDTLGATALGVSGFFTCALWLISARLKPRFAGLDRVQMQWTPEGHPPRPVPRWVALALLPAIGTVALPLLGLAAALGAPENEKLGALLTLVGVGAALSAVHAATLLLSLRWTRGGE